MFNIDEDKIKNWSIERIIYFLGDGVLTDNSECSKGYRDYLKKTPIETLERHIEECVKIKKGEKVYEAKGFILQDIVNELGRRLDYDVDFGIYRGSKQTPGHDGLWKSKDSDIIVEVKSVSHIAFDLDTLGKYKSNLETQGKISNNSSNLIVVHEGDTKAWEQQINGSSYLLTTRIISLEWLVKLVKLKLKKTDDENTHKQIRQILKPISYIKVDKLIEILFSTVEDALEGDGAGSEAEGEEKRTLSIDRELHDLIRNKSIEAFEKKFNVRMIQKTRSLYWDESKKIRVACIVSRRYPDPSCSYFYSYRSNVQKFFSEAENSYLLMSCTDKNITYAIPGEEIDKQVEFLNSTPPDLINIKEGERYYWHLKIKDNDESTILILQKNNTSLNLKEFACEFRE